MSAFLNGNVLHDNSVSLHTYYILCQHKIKIVIIKCDFDWHSSGILCDLNSLCEDLGTEKVTESLGREWVGESSQSL